MKTKIVWTKEHAGMYVATVNGRKAGYITERGGGYWSAVGGDGVVTACEDRATAKAVVNDAIKEFYDK